MTCNIFNQINQTLSHRLHEALKMLLPDGKVIGKYYTCSSIKGGHGQSCKTIFPLARVAIMQPVSHGVI